MEEYLVLEREDTNTVQLWSNCRLPFEPKGWLIDMRQSLRNSLIKLRATPGSWLKAIYTSEENEFCDVENVLIYNVYTGYFKHLCQFGLYLERRFEPVPKVPSCTLTAPRHHHLYTTTQIDENNTYWQLRFVAVEWQGVSCRPLRGELKPHDIWLNVKASTDKILIHKPETNPDNLWGIELEINAPSNCKLNLASIIKPLLDGIISAFHYHDGTNLSLVAGRLAKKLNLDCKIIVENLLDKNHAVLGVRNLLHPFGIGLQWNPADDLFVQIKVGINYCLSENNWNLSGKIYPVEKYNTL